jgi:murein DD-endopeptidase MepM/ murein hydrolase activator NlpD
MAVITSAAIAGTAITASTIAAGTAVAATAATTTMSFVNAGKQKKAMQQAQKDADEAMQEARKKLQVNVYDKLAINKEPYDLQREAMLSQGAQAIQAGVESERGSAATAGRIQMAANEAQAGIRTAMGQDLQQLEMLSAQEDARLRDIGVQLDLEEVAGAQLAAANAQELQAQAMQQGMEGLTSIGSQLEQKAPTFEKTASARQSKRLSDTLTQDFGQNQKGIQQNIANQGIIDGVDFSGVSTMKPDEFQQFMVSLPAETLKKIRQKLPNTVQSFNPNPLAKKPVNPIGFNLFPVTPFAGR